ncbi:DUF371 domain-containing protein [Candidatus Woesearchaeota archaeon]|nr:DUF371 domain-containing protein [Candidatus Woesearchaeota archaeon]
MKNNIIMNKITFTCFGHKNILGTHRNTLEFTHDKELTLKGDCIIGIKTNYDIKAFEKLQPKKIKIILQVDDLEDEITAVFHQKFTHHHEMVIRKSKFTDKRTFAITSSKAAIDINRNLIKKMQNPQQKMIVTIKDEHD